MLRMLFFVVVLLRYRNLCAIMTLENKGFTFCFIVSFFENGSIPASFYLFSSLLLFYCTIGRKNFAGVRIQTADFWCRKQPFYHLSQNHWPVLLFTLLPTVASDFDSLRVFIIFRNFTNHAFRVTIQDTWLTRTDPWHQIDGILFWVPVQQVEPFWTDLMHLTFYCLDTMIDWWVQTVVEDFDK